MNCFIGNIGSVLMVILFVVHRIDSVSENKDGDFKTEKIVALNFVNVGVNENNSTIIQNLRRVKRQGAGKFEEASEMGTLKLARVIVQMIRNLWTKNTVGGTSPWHESVPKPVVMLFKERIGDMLAPPKSKNELEEEGS